MFLYFSLIHYFFSICKTRTSFRPNWNNEEERKQQGKDAYKEKVKSLFY